ncbi:putative linoleate 9S-lipoxygenase 4 [Carex rostrata]
MSRLYNKIRGKLEQREKDEMIEGIAFVKKKNVLNGADCKAPIVDRFAEILGNGISFQLISSTHTDPVSGRGKVGKPAYLENWVTTVSKFSTGESELKVYFEWDESQGIPGAIIVKNHHPCEFFLKHLTIKGLPEKGRVHFVCNSWIYPKYSYDRIFFTNDVYLPSQMPEPLRPYRELELYHLRGDHVSRPLEEKDRIYGYAVYNDLGHHHALGGSREIPYPRRGRTGRASTKSDPTLESRITVFCDGFLEQNYVPRDERFGFQKMSEFGVFFLKSVGHSLFPGLSVLCKTSNEFNSIQETIDLYKGGLKDPNLPVLRELVGKIPVHILKEMVSKDGTHALQLPEPQIIKEDKHAWRADEEFARQMLAGVNPIVIRCLEEFPPTSKLDPKKYGDQTSKIMPEHIEPNLERFTVSEALEQRRLFILDHHDTLMPYLEGINKLEETFIYATRTVLFLRDDGTLKPVAIELSLPHPHGCIYGAESQVHTPSSYSVEGSIWQLARAYASVNDTAYHQIISHWLNTHAVIEPFVIATNRHLSVMHPIHKLLNPHFKDTMNINAMARQHLVNADGIIEMTMFPGKYSLKWSSDVYKTWKFPEQGLPQDLLKRGVAVEDPSSPNNLRLLIEDYPYAVDGLAVWSAIEACVYEYCSIYYPDDNTVEADSELQAWWREVRDVGHGDLKDETWWPAMQTYKDLADTCTTVIWIASALHAAINFGQYPYGGYHPNRPTKSRRPMPKPGSKQYEELKKEPEKVFLKTITPKVPSIIVGAIIEILSRHSSDEVYLGQRDSEEWTSDKKALDVFNRFTQTLIGIEKRITEMNEDPRLKNRRGPAKMPYMLLYPNTSDASGKSTGPVGMGIPNSVSI